MVEIKSKDPAFLFYSSDFLTGCVDLTMEERGQYITLMCLQHQKGHLSEKTIRLSVGSASVDVLDKFNKDKNGNFFNKRLENEIEKRETYAESRRLNGSKGGRPKKNEKPYAKPYENLHENVNVNEIDNIIKNLDPYASPEIEKIFSLYKENCKNLGKLTFERNDKKSREQVCEFLKVIRLDFDYFTSLCKKANDLVYIVDNKIDLQMLLNNHKGIMNGKFDGKKEENKAEKTEEINYEELSVDYE